jgi:hypothetical protein
MFRKRAARHATAEWAKVEVTRRSGLFPSPDRPSVLFELQDQLAQIVVADDGSLVFCESADNRSNERSLPIDLVRDGRTPPVAGTIASRNPSSSTSAQCIILKRKSLKRVAVGNIDRLLFVGLYAPKCWTR